MNLHALYIQCLTFLFAGIFTVTFFSCSDDKDEYSSVPSDYAFMIKDKSNAYSENIELQQEVEKIIEFFGAQPGSWFNQSEAKVLQALDKIQDSIVIRNWADENFSIEKDTWLDIALLKRTENSQFGQTVTYRKISFTNYVYTIVITNEKPGFSNNILLKTEVQNIINQIIDNEEGCFTCSRNEAIDRLKQAAETIKNNNWRNYSLLNATSFSLALLMDLSKPNMDSHVIDQCEIVLKK